MFNRETILKSLNTENYYVDKQSLDLFLHDWKIDSIYEDEDGLEFFDDLALDRVKRGISLKAQGYSDEQIAVKLQKMEARLDRKKDEKVKPIMVKEIIEPQPAEIVNKQEIVNEQPIVESSEVVPQKSFTLDVSSQTLQMLAEAVAKKISDDITNSDMATRLIEAGGYKRDNEILAKQIQELLDHNKKLASRIEQLENEKAKPFWSRFWN